MVYSKLSADYCLFQFSVWSIGVSEAHARDFFVRQQNSLKSCSIDNSNTDHSEVRKELHCEQHLELFRKYVQENHPVIQDPPINDKATATFAETSAQKLTLFSLILSNNKNSDTPSAASVAPAFAALFSLSAVSRLF